MSLRWGIVSAGNISHDFVTAVKSYPGNTVDIAAVAARDVVKAKEFAKLHGIPTVFKNYEELAASKDIDIAYIGALNHTHYELSKLYLQNGKHVVCEKPLCVNYKQAKSLVDLARKKKLFFMEAVWSRFVPSLVALENEVKSGNLGDVRFVQANFGIITSRRSNKLAGGAILDFGVYVLQFAQYVFKDEPVKVTSSGTVTDDTDESVTVILDYSGGRRAVLNMHTGLQFDNSATVVGTKSSAKLLHPFHCSEHLQTKDGIKDFPLHKGALPYNFVNSGGLAYQAQHVNECIKKGLIESERMSHSDSLNLAKLEDTIRAQIGVHYDFDDKTYD